VVAPDRLSDDFPFARLVDLPDQLEVWLARSGQPPQRAAQLPVDRTRLSLEPPNLDDPEREDDAEQQDDQEHPPPDRRWWESWQEAVAVGLGCEVDLGERADDIDALYVVGIGPATSAALFAAHRDSGRLGLLPPGAPTNTVAGEPAADLAEDPMPWLALLSREARRQERQLSLALTGDRQLLGPLPGDSLPYQTWTRRLLTGLWPALLGYPLTTVFGLGGPAEQAADWAETSVDPLGPFPTIRIGNQPYGVLPATSLDTWVARADDPPIEASLRRPLVILRRRWATAARRGGRGAVEGATAEQLVDLLGQPPASPGYALRAMFPMELWHVALLATGHQISWPELIRFWQQSHPIADELGLRLRRRYSSRGHTRLVRMPLVAPRAPAPRQTAGRTLRRLANLARNAPATFANTAAVEAAIALPMDSLLLRLAIRSLQVALGELGQIKLGVPRWVTPPPIAVSAALPATLSTWIAALESGDVAAAEAEKSGPVHRVLEALSGLRTPGDAELDRLLPATIDTACHRIDPWLVAFARRRLRRMEAHTPLLGAYGWVDQPRPGRPGPTEGRLLHAPSASQAVTAALLRDRVISDPEPERWHMDITSARARRAGRLADEVRSGAHPAEALGREVERAVSDPLLIRALRTRFPQGRDQPTRRTCDGLRLLAADPSELSQLGVPPDVLTELEEIRVAVDVYGDLLVAEAVQHVVEGRADQAGAALDAAAGLARPPVFDVLQTRREGRSVQTSCLIVLPARPGAPNAPTATSSPTGLADPDVAAFLRARLGAAAEWRWQVSTAAGPADDVTLVDLGLEPGDALSLPLGDLERLVRETANDHDAELAERDGSIRYERGTRLVAALGRTPALPGDVGETDITSGLPEEVAGELRERLAALRSAAEALADVLDGAGTDDQRRSGLRLAARWGISPTADPATEDPLAGQVARAGQRLRARLAAAPDETFARGLDPVQLSAAIADLASATGQLAVFGRLRRDDLPTLQTAGQGGETTDLDAAWLRHVAPVRPPLARLEALQLAAGTPAGSGPPLLPWTNRPGDPWQTNAEDLRRLVVAYAPANLDLANVANDQRLAIGLIDRFAEIIPGAEHTTTAAFGFDAPAARAPQAILVAVPPDPESDLDPATLVTIVAETRELAHARMATPADLEDVTGLVPLPLVPATGELAVGLER
jgi:hypothetical protein